MSVLNSAEKTIVYVVHFAMDGGLPDSIFANKESAEKRKDYLDKEVQSNPYMAVTWTTYFVTEMELKS